MGSAQPTAVRAAERIAGAGGNVKLQCRGRSQKLPMFWRSKAVGTVENWSTALRAHVLS